MLIKKVLNFALVFILLFTSMLFVGNTVNKTYAISFEEVSIPNANFENITQTVWEECQVGDWNSNENALYFFTKETKIFYDGKQSVRLPGHFGQDYVFTTKNYVYIDGSSEYRFGVKFRTANKEKFSCKISAIVYSEANAKLAQIDGEEFFAKNNNVWTDVFVDLPVVENAKKIKLQITVISPSSGGQDSDYCYMDGVYGYKNAVVTNSGASIRLSLTESGLRFTGKVDKEFFDQVKAIDANAEVGMIIIPIDYVDAVGEFTAKALSAAGKEYLDIVVSKWNNSANVDSDGYYGFSCAIVNVKEANIKREFCARSYIRYTYNGVEKYVYSDFNVADHARSVYSVANRAMEDLLDYDEQDQKIIVAYANGKTPQV